MDDKNLRRLWSISLMIVAIFGVLNATNNIFGEFIPDMILRVIGVLSIIATIILIFCTVKLHYKKNNII